MPLPAQSVHEGRVQDDEGNARPAGTQVDVLRLLEDGSSAPATLSVFNATTKRFELATNNWVATVGNTGRIRFHAPPGHYRVTWADPPPPVPSEPLDLRLTLPVAGNPCAWPDARADAFALPANDTARLQDEIDRLAAAGGGVLQLAARDYWITSLRLPASVSLEGVDVTVTRLTQLPGAVGAMVVSLPQAGKVQLLRRLHLFGASVGLISGQGVVTGESKKVKPVSLNAGATVTDVDQWLAEGLTIPAYASVVSVKEPDQVTLNQGSTLEQGVPTTTPLRFRKPYKLPQPQSITGQTLTFAVGTSFTDILPGMRLVSKDWPDADLLYIKQVKPVARTLTLNRTPPTAPAVNGVMAYVHNCGVYVPSALEELGAAFDPDASYPAPVLESVQISECSGHGVLCMEGRHGLVLHASSKSVANGGCGVRVEGARDVAMRNKVGVGGNWRQAVWLRGCANARWEGCEAWLTTLADACVDMHFTECDGLQYLSGDLNGRLRVDRAVGASGPAPRARVAGINFKWEPLERLLPLMPSADYLALDGVDLVLDAPYFYPQSADIADALTTPAPKYLWTLRNGASLLVDGTRIIPAEGHPMRTHLVAMGDVAAGCRVAGSVLVQEDDTLYHLGDWHGSDTPLPVPEPHEVGYSRADARGAGSSALDLATAVAGEVLAFSGAGKLPAGDWEVSGMVQLKCSNSTASLLEAGVAVGSEAGIPAALERHAALSRNGNGFTGTLQLQVGPFPLRLAADSNVKLMARAEFSGGTVKAWGTLYARRMR